MFGLTTKKKYNILREKNNNLTKIALEKVMQNVRLGFDNLDLKEELKKLKSKEFRKKELTEFFKMSGENIVPVIETKYPELWKEYKSLFQKESCETKKNLLSNVSTQELDIIQSQIMQLMKEDFKQGKKNKESLLNSVKEILDWYKSEELQFTPESKNDIKDMFLNLEIAYKNMTGSFGEHKSDSEEIIKEI